MAVNSLSRRDFNVLEKIQDPESDPATSLLVDPSLPKDPLITDASVYERVTQKEKQIVLAIQQLEMQIAGLKSGVEDPVEEYHQCLSTMDELVSEFPRYASIRNNRAQACRRLYGDLMLVPGQSDPKALVLQGQAQISEAEIANLALSDLDEAISLLTPRTPFGAMSPQAARTLSMAHTQRAAIYHMTAKAIESGAEVVSAQRKEAQWSKLDFEQAASRDFAFGGRYGNNIAKGLAVSTNPTAKLCGQIVREAMKKEYGPSFAA